MPLSWNSAYDNNREVQVIEVVRGIETIKNPETADLLGSIIKTNGRWMSHVTDLKGVHYHPTREDALTFIKIEAHIRGIW